MYIDGDYLKKIRKALKYKMDYVSRNIGCSINTLYRIENGNKHLDFPFILRLIEFYNIDINTIIKFDNIHLDLKEIKRLEKEEGNGRLFIYMENKNKTTS